MEADSDWLVVGRFGRPYGVKGLITVVSFTEPRDNLLNYTDWHIQKNHVWQPLVDFKTKSNHNRILVQINGYNDRDQVAELTHLDIAILRHQLRELGKNDYYWHELIGMTVVHDKTNHTLGQVTELLATGSNDVLIVEEEERNQRHLIPYLWEDVILQIDKAQGLIVVNWDMDY